MLKILIVDDEQLARARLISLIDELDIAHKIYEADHGLIALEMVNKVKPDILLLDIRMPVMDGLEVAHHLTSMEDAPAVVFTTAYQDHALEAFDTHAVDYLLKPVRKERLKLAIERAGILQRSLITKLRNQDYTARQRTHLSTRVQGNIKLIPVKSIRYLRAEQKYVIAGWPDGEMLLDESLVALEEEFQDVFIRIHRNALIAHEYIDMLEKQKNGIHMVTMHGVPAVLQVSRRNLASLRKKLIHKQE